MYKRITFTGPSGTGKSTWANYISKEYQIPLVNTQGGILWEKYGIKNHREVITRGINDPGWAFNYCLELLQQRHEAYTGSLHNGKGFISERSAIDNLVYALTDFGSVFSYEQMDILADKALVLHKCMDLIIYLPFHEALMQRDDPKRIQNKWYQEMSDTVFEMLINKFGEAAPDTKIICIPTIDKIERKKAIDSILQSDEKDYSPMF